MVEKSPIFRRSHTLPLALLGVVLSMAWVGFESAPALAANSFSPPVDNFAVPAELPPLRQELAQKSFGDAWRRLDVLLRDHADELMTTDYGALAPLSTTLSALPAEQKAGLVAEFRGKNDAQVRDLFDAMRHSGSASLLDLYSLARRYPFSSVAGSALALAGQRAMENGDLASANTLFQSAIQQDWKPDESQVRQIDLLRKMEEQQLLGTLSPQPPPPDNRPTSKSLFPYVGAVTFDATWFDPVGGLGEPHFFPVLADDRFFIVSTSHVLCLREGGVVGWNWGSPQKPALPQQTQILDKSKAAPAPQPQPQPIVRRPGMPIQPVQPIVIVPAPAPTVGHMIVNRRGMIFEPGLLLDVTGHAQLVVARQPTDHLDQYCLRAFRASDGKLLWSSDAAAETRDLSFASNPCVCGRYTYAIALETTPMHDGATLLMVACDTLGGQVLWRCPLGSFAGMAGRKPPSAEFPAWGNVFEQTAPLAAGEMVYATPNVGQVFAIGRFDGKPRWIQSYPSMLADGPTIRARSITELTAELNEQARMAERLHDAGPNPPKIGAEIQPAMAQRFGSTPTLCGSAVIVAPIDTVVALSFDAVTGKTNWQNNELYASTLIGRGGGGDNGGAIFAGSTLTSLDAILGSKIWIWPPPSGPPSKASGPPVVQRRSVYVPTAAGTLVLSSSDGTIVRDTTDPAALLNFRKMLNIDIARYQLDAMGVAKSFGLPIPP